MIQISTVLIGVKKYILKNDNSSKITNKQSGLVCDGVDWRLKGNMCIIYEIVPAIQY